MKFSLLLACIAISTLFTGCAENGSLTVGGVPVSSSDAQAAAQVTLTTAGDVALANVKSVSDRKVIAAQLIAVGNAVNTLAAGGIVTPDQLTATLNQFSPKVATQEQAYSAFATIAESTWTLYYPKISANGDTASALAWLKVIAQSAVSVGTANQ